MTALTNAHLNKLTDEELRAIALPALNDALSALNTSIEEYDLANHPKLDPARFHRAAAWLRKLLTNPDNGYADDMLSRHSYAVYDFRQNTTYVRPATTADYGLSFPPYLNAAAVGSIFGSVYRYGGTPHRPSAYLLLSALDRCGDAFIPGHDTPARYVIGLLHPSDDPRLPALAESYLQSGLHANLRPAINRATRQLARLDELADLNR